ncbi:LapA family protein [Alphaproteobacteria bacterium]|nr:LapA family protein [Alphaproteobacteria bacterium]
MNFLNYLSKSFWSLLLLLLVIAAVTFAISNRTMVTFSLWPLEIEVTLPLGATVLASLALGLIAGTGIMAISRWKIRREALNSKRRVALLEKTVIDSTTTTLAPAAAAPEPGPRRVLSDH